MASDNIQSELIEKWIQEELDLEAIEQRLNSLGLDVRARATYLQAYKKARHQKQQLVGFVYCGIGAFLGFVSCLLAIFNPIPEFFYWILFGLTSVSLIIICLGLYYIFE